MDRLYRLLLRAYPRAFRTDNDAAMLELFRVQRVRAARQGRRAAFWAFVLDDLVRNAVALRLGQRNLAVLPRERHARRRFTPPPATEAMFNIFREARQAARRLIQAPIFTLTAVAIVALGIGANSAMFSVVNTLALRPQPYADADRIVDVYQDSDAGEPNSSSFPAFRDMQAQRAVFSDATAAMANRAMLQTSDGVQAIAVEYVVSNYFDLLGLPLHRGRTFAADEDVTGGPLAAIVGYDYWVTRLAADPQILGRTLRFGQAAITVVGIGAPGYGGVMPGLRLDFWLSLSSLGAIAGDYAGGTLERREDHWFFVKARLADGVRVEQAQAAMDALAERLATEYPELNQGRDITVFAPGQVRLHPSMDAQLLPASAAMMLLVGLILLIACSNLANLLLVRGTSRGAEVSVRRALGASRPQILGHLLAESLILSLAGGVLGLVLAVWTVNAILGLQADLPLPATLDLRIDPSVVLFTAALSLITGILFGAAPALRMMRMDVVAAIREDTPILALGRRRFNARNLLVMAQVAASVVILVVAGLLTRSLANARSVDLGFDAGHLVAISTDTSFGSYEGDGVGTFYNELRERVAALPGVTSAALAAQLPVRGFGGSSTLFIEGYESPAGTGNAEVLRSTVDAGYFATMGTAVLHGREFDTTDTRDSALVGVISESMARAYWGRSDVVGERFGFQSVPDTWVRIVGVVGDIKTVSVTEPPTPVFYRPTAQGIGPNSWVIARVESAPENLVRPLREALREIDPTLPLMAVTTFEDHVQQALLPARAGTAVVGGFAILGLTLAALGLYAVVAFAVQQRRAEVGIRMALGADAARVTGLVVREAMSVVAIALGIGLVVAAVLGRGLVGVLYNVAPLDAATLGGTALVLIVTAGLASWLPARRAAHIDPVRALRRD